MCITIDNSEHDSSAITYLSIDGNDLYVVNSVEGKVYRYQGDSECAYFE
jgi:hypothetical protein